VTHQAKAPDKEEQLAEGVRSPGEELPDGVPSGFACPECHGVLWELNESELARFRCRVGHAYLQQSLSAAQADKVDEALWTAMRSLKESSALSNRLAERARARNLDQMAAAYKSRAREADTRAQLIENVLKRGQLNAEYPVDEVAEHAPQSPKRAKIKAQ
jgi:hypothetical protein